MAEIRSLSKCFPWSDNNSRGLPCRQIISSIKKEATEAAEASDRALASGHLVRYSIATTMYRLFDLVRGKGPTILIPTLSKGRPNLIGCNGSRVLGLPLC